MNSYKDDFNIRLNAGPSIETVFKYHLLRNNKAIPTFFFVEGRTDELFYSNLRNEKTAKPPAEYIIALNNDLDSESCYVGKTAVLEAFSEINKNDELRKDIGKCVFLIDRDYDGINNYKIKIPRKDRNKFTLTPYHSLECFLFDVDNLKTIFECLNIRSYLEEFRMMLENFARESETYFAYQGTITSCINLNKGIYYKKTYSSDEIFKFKFYESKTYEFNRDKLKTETELMRKSISMNDFAKQKFDMIYRNIRESCLNIHGHTIFSFLTQYLNDIHSIKFSIKLENKNFSTIIDKIRIDMPIVYGDGHIV